MSKIVEIELGGRNCRLNFSVSALFNLGERFGRVGTLDKIWQGILPSGDGFDIFTPEIWENTLAVAEELLKSGAACAKSATGEDVPAPTAGELREMLTVAEFVQLHAAVINAIRESLGRTVETEDSTKKETATPGN